MSAAQPHTEATTYAEAQRHVMHLALALTLFCVCMTINMLSPVFEARLLALLGVFFTGVGVYYRIGVLAGAICHKEGRNGH